MSIAHSELLQRLHYDPDTGIWIWLEPPSNSCKAKTRADLNHKSSYRTVKINKKKQLSHRLAWFYMTGSWPTAHIDHRDRDGNNNRWNNLRLASRSENAANSKRPRTNTSGYKGVIWCAKTKCWRARIEVNGKTICVGTSRDKESARELYVAAAKKYFGEFANVD